MAVEQKELAKSLSKLSLNQDVPTTSSTGSKKKTAVADSWEDEDSSGDETDRPLSPQASADYPTAPPPTPISPTSSGGHDIFINPYGYTGDGTTSPRSERSGARPEKTDAVAKRMIAGALGVRAPKKTEEQRAYDRAVKEKEMKRRSEEKEAAAKAKADAERAKAAIWDD